MSKGVAMKKTATVVSKTTPSDSLQTIRNIIKIKAGHSWTVYKKTTTFSLSDFFHQSFPASSHETFTASSWILSKEKWSDLRFL